MIAFIEIVTRMAVLTDTATEMIVLIEIVTRMAVLTGKQSLE
jgi:hypothetical protein